METTATKTAEGWTLNGSKTWISNSPVADLFVIWAREVIDGQKGKVRGFLVEKVQSGASCFGQLTVCRALLACPPQPSRTNSLSAPQSPVLSSWKTSRLPLMPSCPRLEVSAHHSHVSTMLVMGSRGESWAHWKTASLGREITPWSGELEHSVSIYRAHTRHSKQFGKPIASFQLVQKKLADALTATTVGLLGSLQLGRLKDAGQWAPDMVSMMKRNNTSMALQHSRILLDILGGNACSDE